MNASFLKFPYIPQHKAPFSCYSLFNARNLLFFTVYMYKKLESEEGDTFFIQTPLILLLLFFIAPSNEIMEATILRTAATFILLFLFVISDASIAVNSSCEAIQTSRKLDYQENEILFSPLTEKDAAGIPIVKPTIVDTSPIINPTTPQPPILARRKLDYQENEIVVPPLAEVDAAGAGDIPIVNPTVPGTTPIINPTTPQPPSTTTPSPIIPEPPATTTPIIPEPPATTTPIIPEPPATTTPTNPGSPASSTSGGSWCIANPSASQTALQVALDYACGYGGADCSAIQPGAPCYDPATLRDHASYAFNSYYHKNPIPTSCAFGGSAQLTTTDPSHGSCQFAASSSSTPTTPPKTTTPTIPMTPTVPMTPPTPTFPMTPPSLNTPVAPYTPGGNGGSDPTGFDNGLEPTGSPSSARKMSVNLLMLVIVNCLVCQLLQPTISKQMGI